MNMTTEKAQKLIAGVLAELEKDTGQFVIDINIQDLDTTCFEDNRQHITRHVNIELHRLPGTHWAK